MTDAAMRIIDAHAHFGGSCRVFDTIQTPDELLTAMNQYDVEASVVQPHPGSENPAADHDLIAAVATEHPGRIFGMASLNPHQDQAAYRAELRRCVEELGFVAVKLHPLGHAVMPGSRDGDLVLRTAADLGIVVMIHTGPGAPFADPAAWLPSIRAYPDLSIILGHAGAGISTWTAIVVAEQRANTYLETSWCRPHDIARAVATLGTDRVLFGSDLTFNIPVELAKHHAAGLSPSELEATLAGNAARVYELKL